MKIRERKRRRLALEFFSRINMTLYKFKRTQRSVQQTLRVFRRLRPNFLFKNSQRVTIFMSSGMRFPLYGLENSQKRLLVGVLIDSLSKKQAFSKFTR